MERFGFDPQTGTVATLCEFLFVMLGEQATGGGLVIADPGPLPDEPDWCVFHDDEGDPVDAVYEGRTVSYSDAVARWRNLTRKRLCGHTVNTVADLAAHLRGDR